MNKVNKKRSRKTGKSETRRITQRNEAGGWKHGDSQQTRNVITHKQKASDRQN